MAKSAFPKAKDTIKLIHKLSTLPLKLLSSMNIGPLGGDNSISVIIETVLALRRGEKLDYELSKSEKYFIKNLTKSEIPDKIVEYRELSHEAQNQIISSYGSEKLGVIWIGAGIYTLSHPLLNHNSEENWHIWTDISPKVVHSALQAFARTDNEQQAANLSHTIRLPKDGKRLAEWVHFLKDHVDRIIIMGYGLTYALTPDENYSWLKEIKDVKVERPLHFVFNSPGDTIEFLPGMMAAFHNQRMIHYTHEHVEVLFQKAFNMCQISWHKARENTRTKTWETWIVDILPETQSA